MQFLPDVYVPCDLCHGTRYNTDTLQVHYKGKTIADVLDMPIEENLDVIKTADWVIDLGPEGGTRGGDVIATGTPEQVAQAEQSYTGQYLRKVLDAQDVTSGRAA